MNETDVLDLLTEIVQATRCDIPPEIALVTPGLCEKYSSIVVQPRSAEIDMLAVKLFLVNKYFNLEYSKMSLDELEYTIDEIRFVENIINGKHNWYWQRFRAGRITATHFLNVCRTSISKPAISTINNICWPEKNAFTSVATEYGIAHEPVALKAFSAEMSQSLILSSE